MFQITMLIFAKEYDENFLFYVPNNYGANSFELWDQMNYLVNNQFIKEEKNRNSIRYNLLDKGKEILFDKKLQKKYEHEVFILLEIIKQANKLDKWLVNYVYCWYPEYTEKSLIFQDVIERMSNDRKRNAARIIKVLRNKIQMKNKI